MTDRERLIALLKSNMNVLQAAGTSATATLRLADNLIAGGVRVSAVPIGSTVYALYNRNPAHRGGRKNTMITRNSQIATNRNLEIAKINGGNIEIRAKKATMQDVNLLGRLVFVTREEAERMLSKL